MTEHPVYIGIDPAAGIRLSSYAVLDAQLKIVKMDRASIDDLITLAAGYPAAVCAVDAPIAPSKGLLADRDYRKRLGLEPGRSTYKNCRVCEYELRKRKIALYTTPKSPDQAPLWMKEGWRLYDGLRKADFVEYPRVGSRRMLETYPYAIFMALVGKRPYSKSSIEGLLQRQLILFEEGVDVPDPMPHLEEWTRYRIKTGQIGRDNVLEHDSLDALAAAYTAYMVDREPRSIIALGDTAEGQIVLPVESLKDVY
jgi:predicted nuclease with RNAse H fold